MTISLRRALLPLAAAAFAVLPAAAQQPLDQAYRADATRLIQAALDDSVFAYGRLGTMVDRFGPRPAGSASLEQAIDWILGEMRRDGLQNVRGEPVTVPHWQRGAESLELLSPRATPLHMIGLGGTIGTPPQGLTAEVLVVSSAEELARRAADARGKIVLFDVPFTSYRETVVYRSLGANAAAKAGAVAALIRSVSSFSMQNPHTGSMRYYDTTVVRVPIAAVSVEDAMMLHRMQDRGEPIRVRLTMTARMLPNAQSRATQGR